MSKEREALVKALSAVIEAAPIKERAALANAIEAYAEKFPRTWTNVSQKNGVMVSEVFEVIVEGCEAMPGLAAEMAREAD